jgi:NADH:ubiquinone oxidoreductase subunit C
MAKNIILSGLLKMTSDLDFIFSDKYIRFKKYVLHSLHLDTNESAKSISEYLSNMDRILITSTVIDLIKSENRFAIVSSLSEYSTAETIYMTQRTPLKVESLGDIFPSAIWLEREMYDLFGVIFHSAGGNTDLRRILTDYNFRGHPMRKDFGGPGYYTEQYDVSNKQIVREKPQTQCS